MSHRRRNRAAFTLMEVLLVLVILVVLGSLAGIQISKMHKSSLISAATTEIDSIEVCIEAYQLHMNNYPASLDALLTPPADLTNPARWQGPYLNEPTLPLDPWDRPYLYTYPGEKLPGSYDLWSAGPDGIENSDDDIGNWQ